MVSETRSAGRLMMHWSRDASWNMAVDEAVMQSVSATAEAEGMASAVMRFYSWERPTLSLGYFQSSREAMPRFESLAQVRRSTGGGAIVHDRELTYSLTVATPPGQRGARHDLYQGVHAAIVEQFRELGVTALPYRLDRQRMSDEDAFLCFQRRTEEDLVVSGYKIVGSAQRRAKRAVLQHGSVLLRASSAAPELPGAFDLTSRSIDRLAFAEGLAARVGRLLRVDFRESELTPAELGACDRVQHEKYGNQDWLQRR